MGRPIDARKSPTAVDNLAMNKSYIQFEKPYDLPYRVPVNYPGAGRRVYPQHADFVAMHPHHHLLLHYGSCLNLIRSDNDTAHRCCYDEYAVLDMDAVDDLDTIKLVFQDFWLASSTWTVDGNPLRPQDIHRTALLTIAGELDDISGTGQIQTAHNLCTGIAFAQCQHSVTEGAGSTVSLPVGTDAKTSARWCAIALPRTHKALAALRAKQRAAHTYSLTNSFHAKYT